ncbi:MAG: hypothetical protein JWQ27_2266 [Ferruginibacter sp.]|nr:hypothetical protein [Ferruginibacter sp.]
MKKLFILDDNEELLEITQLILGKDYIVYAKPSAESIAEELRNFQPDLMLIDHFVGDHNSEEIMHHIQHAIPNFSVPFILFSASHDISEKAAKLGAAGFIEKPSSISYIKEYIKKFFHDDTVAETK